MGRRKKYPKTEEEETAERQREISSKIRQVYNLILPCIKDYMTKGETMHHLYAYHNLEPVYTEKVWDRLVEQNNEFFGAYLVRLALKKQIERFNEYLEQHKEKMLLAGVSFVSQNSDPGCQTSKSMQVTGQTQINMNCSTNPSVAETSGHPSENLSFTAANNNFSHHPHSGGIGVNGVPVHGRHPVNGEIGVGNCHMRHYPYSRSQRNSLSQNSDLRCQTSNSMQVTGQTQINTNCSTNPSVAETNGYPSENLSFSTANNNFSHHPHSGGIGVNGVPVHARHPVNGDIGVGNCHMGHHPYSRSQRNSVPQNSNLRCQKSNSMQVTGQAQINENCSTNTSIAATNGCLSGYLSFSAGNNSFSRHPHSGGVGVNSVPVHARHLVNGGIGVDNGHILDSPYSGSQWNDVADYIVGHHPHLGGIGVNNVPVRAPHPVNRGIGVDNGNLLDTPYSGSQWNDFVDYSLGHFPRSPGIGVNYVPVHACDPVNGGIGVDNVHILDAPCSGSQWNDVVDYSVGHRPHSGDNGVNNVLFHARHSLNGDIGVNNGHIDGNQWSNGAGYSLSHCPPSVTHWYR